MICARCKGTFFGKPVEARFPDGSWKLVSKICAGKLRRGPPEPKSPIRPMLSTGSSSQVGT